MVDVDIDDWDLAAEIQNACEQVKALARAPVRYRKNASRVAYLVRTDVDHERFTTSKFSGGRVEFKLGKGEFCFGWGKHPSGVRLWWEVAEKSYSHPDDFPDFDALPFVSRDKLFALSGRLERQLREACGEPMAPPIQFTDMEVVEDLRMDMVFQLPNGSETTLEDLYSGPGTSEIVNLTPWRPDSDSCGGHLTYSREFEGPCLTDFVTGQKHVLSREPFSVPDIPELVPGQRDKEEALGRWLNRLIYILDVNRYMLIGDPTGLTMTREAAFAAVPPKERSAVSLGVPRFARAIWDPRLPPSGAIETGDDQVIEYNTYMPPKHPNRSGSTDDFWAFFESFVPNDAERESVWKWLAHKAQHPGERGFATLFYGPQGSGKGTLWQIIASLWEDRHVAKVGNIQSVYDAAYHDALYRTLFVLVDEAAAEDASWRGKMQAKERLKAFVDPGSRRQLLNIKTRAQVLSVVCCTVGIATNNLDGVPIDSNDRRFNVVKTGRELSSQQVKTIHAWRSEPSNIGRLWDELISVDLTGYNAVRAPWSQTKEDMHAATMSDIDELALQFAEAVRESGGVFGVEHAQSWLDHAFALGVEQKQLKALKRILLAKAPSRTCRVDGKVRRVRTTDDAPAELTGLAVKKALAHLDRVLKKKSQKT